MNEILFINSLTNGGAEKIVSLISKRNKLKVITIWPDNFQCHPSELHVSLLKKRGFLPTDLLLCAFLLSKYIRLNDVSVVNSHLFWANYLNIFASFFTSYKTMCTHCVAFSSKFENNRFLAVFHKVMTKIVLKCADCNTFKSADMEKDYLSLFHVNNPKVIYNPCNLFGSQDHLPNDHNFEFNENKKYVLCVGRFHATKNQISIINAIPYIDVEFIFLGDGELLHDCREEAIRLNIIDRVHFLGSVKNVSYYFNYCDFYLSCSKSEGFPNALIEAIYFNCYPIVFNCISGPKEIISNFYREEPIECNDNFERYPMGIVLKSYSNNSLTGTLARYKDEKLLIRESSRNKFFEVLGEDKTLGDYYDTYEDLKRI